MKSRMIIIITLLVLVLGVGGAIGWWKFFGPGKGGAVQGVEATPTETVTATEEVLVEEEAVPTDEPVATEEPQQAEESQTMEGCVTIRVLNARIGPGKEYPAAGGLGKGECVPFDARSADNLWLRVYGRAAERGDRLWASIYYITLNGDINDLPVADVEPPAEQ